MKSCEACGRSHHIHTENELSNCLVWANGEVRGLREMVDRLRKLCADRPMLHVPSQERDDWVEKVDEVGKG